MSKRTIGILSTLAIIMALVGAGMIVIGIVGGSTTATAQMTGFANLPLFIVGVVVASLALFPYLFALAGALTNLALLQQWRWFVRVLIFHGIALLMYLIVGPTTPDSATPNAPSTQHVEQLSKHAQMSTSDIS